MAETFVARMAYACSASVPGARPIRSLPFVLVTLAFCALFALVREVHPWWILSVASWSIMGWLAMAVFAAVLGLFLA